MSAMSAAPAGWRLLPLYPGGFANLIGPLYVSESDSETRIGFRIEPQHTNPMGVCHGGMLASFCDMLLPISVLRQTPAIGQRFLPTINLQLDYLAPAPLGAWVEGRAQLLRQTRSLVFAQALVHADETAVVRASAILKIGPEFPPPKDTR